MKEKILRVEETAFKRDGEDWRSYVGYQIVTNEQTIKFGISEGQSCCENYGYFITNDDASEFEGATLKSIDVVDDCLKKEKAPDFYEGGVMFVNFETSKGTLQFTAYNSHNGSYGHTAVLLSKQKTAEDVL